jgi:hypothetical protein
MGSYGKYFNIYILTSICLLAAFGLQALYHRTRAFLDKHVAGERSRRLATTAFVLMGALALTPVLVSTSSFLNTAFSQSQPSYARGDFFQVSYRFLIGAIKKRRKSVANEDQYFNVRRNIGTITWNGNIVLPENAVPKFIIDRTGEYPNPDYVGEAAFVGPHSNEARVTEFILGYNSIRLRYSSTVPQLLLLNFNFHSGWASDQGDVQQHDGLLAIKIEPAIEREITLTFSDPLFSIGCYIAAISAVAFVFTFVYVSRRTRKPSARLDSSWVEVAQSTAFATNSQFAAAMGTRNIRPTYLTRQAFSA